MSGEKRHQGPYQHAADDDVTAAAPVVWVVPAAESGATAAIVAAPVTLVYVDDVVFAMRRLAATPAAAGEAYNVVDPDEIDWRRYFDVVADANGAVDPPLVW